MDTRKNARPQDQHTEDQLHMAEAIIDMLHGRNQRLSSQVSVERSVIRQLRTQAISRTWQIQDVQRDKQQAVYTQLGLALDKPQQVIAFTPYSRTNGKAEYVEDIEQLQCRLSPPKRWLLATISLAYCRDGWRYGFWMNLPTSNFDKAYPCAAANKPLKTRALAIQHAKDHLLVHIRQLEQFRADVRDLSDYQAVTAWIADVGASS